MSVNGIVSVNGTVSVTGTVSVNGTVALNGHQSRRSVLIDNQLMVLVQRTNGGNHLLGADGSDTPKLDIAGLRRLIGDNALNRISPLNPGSAKRLISDNPRSRRLLQAFVFLRPAIIKPASGVKYRCGIVFFNMNINVSVCAMQALPKICFTAVVVDSDVYHRRIGWHG